MKKDESNKQKAKASHEYFERILPGIYNLLSHRNASRIYREVPGVSEVYVWLLSEIGTPIDQPQIATAQLIMENGSLSDVGMEAAEIIEKELENIHAFSMELVAGKCPIC